jgi:hypothetical protein
MTSLTNYMTDIISWYDRANRSINSIGRMSFTLRFNSFSYMGSLCINFGGEFAEVPQNTSPNCLGSSQPTEAER